MIKILYTILPYFKPSSFSLKKTLSYILNPFLDAYLYTKYLPQKILFEKNKDWKVLIILDACRFDFFQKIVYPQLLRIKVKGRLFPAVSPATHTGEWFKNIFSNDFVSKKNIVYLCPTPLFISKPYFLKS